MRDTGCGKTYNTYYSEFQSDIGYDLCRWENESTSERFFEKSTTWILMKFCQIVEGIRTFRLKKTASKTERYISVSRHFEFVYFNPYNPYFCLKILRGVFCVITYTYFLGDDKILVDVVEDIIHRDVVAALQSHLGPG